MQQGKSGARSAEWRIWSPFIRADPLTHGVTGAFHPRSAGSPSLEDLGGDILGDIPHACTCILPVLLSSHL